MEEFIINTVEYIEINGIIQCVSIRTVNTKNPLLLYLHGGPGDTALPLVSKYNSRLEEDFTVVVLEQRGVGKSYYHFSQCDKISINSFVDDVYILSKHLLKHFEQEKLYIIGHSWGSVLGLKFIQLYPHLVHSYIGCGQVVNMKKSSKIAYEFVLQKNEKHKNDKIVRKLESIDYTYSQLSWLDDLLFVTGQVVKHKGSLYGKTNYNRFVLDFLLSKDYSLKDLINRQKGSLQSIQYLWQELMDINFEDIKDFQVPVIFVEGRHDYHVSSELVFLYYNTINSQKQFIWFEHSCHFPQWSESEKFYNVMHNIRTYEVCP